MNWVDLLIIAWLAHAVYDGYRRYAVGAAIYFFGFILAVFVANFFSDHFCYIFGLFQVTDYQLAKVLTGFIIFFIFFMAAIIISFFLRKWSCKIFSPKLDRLVGMQFGLLYGIYLSGTLFYYVSFCANDFFIYYFNEKSLFVPVLTNWVIFFNRWILQIGF